VDWVVIEETFIPNPYIDERHEMYFDFAPPVGELTPFEVEILDSTLPAVALGDDTPLLHAMEEILYARVSRGGWETYQRLPQDEKLAVLDKVRARIPLLTRG